METCFILLQPCYIVMNYLFTDNVNNQLLMIHEEINIYKYINKHLRPISASIYIIFMLKII